MESAPDTFFNSPRVHFMRNALAHAGKSGRRVVSAFMATAFAQNDAEAARQQWRRVADQLRAKLPKLSTLMDDAEADVLAYMGFPAQQRAKLHSTNPLERLNGEVKRRTEVVGIFPSEAAIRRLVGVILLKQNDERAVQRARYMTLVSFASVSDDPLVSLAHIDADPGQAGDPLAIASYTTPWDTTPQSRSLRHKPIADLQRRSRESGLSFCECWGRLMYPTEVACPCCASNDT